MAVTQASVAEKNEKRRKLLSEARQILETADKEKRKTTEEEDRRYATVFADAQTLKAEMERDVAQIEAERAVVSHGFAESGGENRATTATTPVKDSEKRMKAFRKWIATGDRAEYRAFTAGTDSEGGFLVAPETFNAELIKDLDNLLFIREFARKLPLTKPGSVGTPTLDTDAEDSDWTTELGTGNEEDSLRFGKRSLTTHPLAKRVKESRDLIESASMPVDQIVRERMAFKMKVTQEKAFMTGDGNKKPLGVFVASADGVPTSRDETFAFGSTIATIDGLKAMKYSITQQHRSNLRWTFHRDGVEIISKAKDGQGNYIWKEGITESEPDRLLGFPVDESEYAPNTYTSGLYSCLLADWSYYWIVESAQIFMQVLFELYAETNQIGFIMRMHSDGAPVLPGAFARGAVT